MVSFRILFTRILLAVKKKIVEVVDDDRVIMLAPTPATEGLLLENSDDGLPESWHFARTRSLKRLPEDVKLMIADFAYKNKFQLARIIKEIFTSEVECSVSSRIEIAKYNSDTAVDFCTSNLRSLKELPSFMLPDPVRDSQSMYCDVMPKRMKPGSCFGAGTSVRWNCPSTNPPLRSLLYPCADFSVLAKKDILSSSSMLVALSQHINGIQPSEVYAKCVRKLSDGAGDRVETFIYCPLANSSGRSRSNEEDDMISYFKKQKFTRVDGASANYFIMQLRLVCVSFLTSEVCKLCVR
jgi:hypothetical protein